VFLFLMLAVKNSRKRLAALPPRSATIAGTVKPPLLAEGTMLLRAVPTWLSAPPE
jgi:hypothetical protein